MGNHKEDGSKKKEKKQAPVVSFKKGSSGERTLRAMNREKRKLLQKLKRNADGRRQKFKKIAHFEDGVETTKMVPNGYRSTAGIARRVAEINGIFKNAGFKPKSKIAA